MSLRDALEDVPVVGVIRGCPPEHVAAMAAAAVKAGFAVVEVTMNSTDAPAQIRAVRDALGDHVLVGAGTIRSPADVDAAVDAGAAFGVAPELYPLSMERARSRDLPFVPGTMTPTEIAAAWREGAEMVKVFPAVTLGPDYFRALRGPMPDVPLLATGGVTAASGRALLEAGADAVGCTSVVFDPDAMRRGDAAEIEARAAFFLAELGLL